VLQEKNKAFILTSQLIRPEEINIIEESKLGLVPFMFERLDYQINRLFSPSLSISGKAEAYPIADP
jgi:hypothetical protein